MVISDIKTFLKRKKDKKRQYERERYKNVSDDKNQRLVQYKKILLHNAKK